LFFKIKIDYYQDYFKKIATMSRYSYETFDLSDNDYKKYNVEFMMVDYKNDSHKEIYNYMYNTETQWLNQCNYQGKPEGKWLENTLAIEESTILNNDLAKLASSFVYGTHIQILCHIDPDELITYERRGIRVARCYVILNNTERDTKKQIKQKLKDLQRDIIPYGKNILEEKYNLDIEWVDCQNQTHGKEIFKEIDYIRFVICTRQHYFEKSCKIITNGYSDVIYYDFVRGSGRNSIKQRTTDVLRTGVTIWPTPFIDFLLHIRNFTLFHLQINTWPFSGRRTNFLRFG